MRKVHFTGLEVNTIIAALYHEYSYLRDIPECEKRDIPDINKRMVECLQLASSIEELYNHDITGTYTLQADRW